jgi:hypothetical protein
MACVAAQHPYSLGGACVRRSPALGEHGLDKAQSGNVGLASLIDAVPAGVSVP